MMSAMMRKHSGSKKGEIIMKVFEMKLEAIPKIARLMCTIKPDWWDYEGAFSQLSGVEDTIHTIGWYLGEDENTPKGWILCRELIGYRALELECSGFDDNGEFKLEHKLGELIREAESYARRKGYLDVPQENIYDRGRGFFEVRRSYWRTVLPVIRLYFSFLSSV